MSEMILKSLNNGVNEMIIDLYSDIVCPWCRIGKKNLDDALLSWEHQNEIIINYRAFQLDPTLPEQGLPFREIMMKKMGSEDRLKQITDQVTTVGKNVGLIFHFDQITLTPNTRLCHRLISLLPQHTKGTTMDAIMTAYFEKGENITELDTLFNITKKLGVYTPQLQERLQSGDGLDAVLFDLDQAKKIGVTGVPFFVLNNRFALSGAYPVKDIVKALEQANND